MKIVAISDVHGKWNKLQIPECDILISVGDYSFRGEPHMVKDYHRWLNKQEAGHIISIQGNHELWVEKNFQEAKAIAQEECPSVHFIDEGLVQIQGLNIWCSAITPWFHDWAWNKYRGDDIARHWNMIPDDVDIIATHGPVYGIHDELVQVDGSLSGNHVGCNDLLKRIQEIKPDIHLCGHIHAHGGRQVHRDGTSFYNVSVCDEMYIASNPITVIEYEKI